MSLLQGSLLVGVVVNMVSLGIIFLKLTSWLSNQITKMTERQKKLEEQVNNDITGRRVVGEMRQDIAVIKTQISDMREDLKALRQPVHS
jgi:predicted  nucleic acid-binding Zn-ribbon protein